MKKIMIVCIAALGLSVMKVDAQYIRRKPKFSINISIGAPGPPPYQGAIWVEPGWRWQNGRYVEVPGYWLRPRGGAVWVPGRWGYTKRGYRWRAGHWR